jgi:hypothetical protein
MAIVFSTLVGAMAGLLAGLVLLPVIRYAAYLAGRSITGGPGVVIGIAAGALVFTLMALADKND